MPLNDYPDGAIVDLYVEVPLPILDRPDGFINLKVPVGPVGIDPADPLNAPVLIGIVGDVATNSNLVDHITTPLCRCLEGLTRDPDSGEFLVERGLPLPGGLNVEHGRAPTRPCSLLFRFSPVVDSDLLSECE